MAKHFNGFVSRFSAGGKVSHSHAQLSLAQASLRRLGVSLFGSQDLVGGNGVSQTADCHRVAGIVGGILDFVAGETTKPLMVPAVQKIRDVPKKTWMLGELGFTGGGARQIFQGQPASNAEDRLTLGRFLVFSSTAAGGGGLNEMTIDDTAGKEK